MKMERIIKSIEDNYLLPSLDLVEDVFAKWDSPEEGKVVRQLVEEIRSKKYYIPELELIMVSEYDDVIGYAMFSRFHIEGRYENELLMLTPVAVKTELQRQHKLQIQLGSRILLDADDVKATFDIYEKIHHDGYTEYIRVQGRLHNRIQAMISKNLRSINTVGSIFFACNMWQ